MNATIKRFLVALGACSLSGCGASSPSATAGLAEGASDGESEASEDASPGIQTDSSAKPDSETALPECAVSESDTVGATLSLSDAASERFETETLRVSKGIKVTFLMGDVSYEGSATLRIDRRIRFEVRGRDALGCIADPIRVDERTTFNCAYEVTATGEIERTVSASLFAGYADGRIIGARESLRVFSPEDQMGQANFIPAAELIGRPVNGGTVSRNAISEACTRRFATLDRAAIERQLQANLENQRPTLTSAVGAERYITIPGTVGWSGFGSREAAQQACQAGGKRLVSASAGSTFMNSTASGYRTGLNPFTSVYSCFWTENAQLMYGTGFQPGAPLDVPLENGGRVVRTSGWGPAATEAPNGRTRTCYALCSELDLN